MTTRHSTLTNNHFPINTQAWLREGLIFQTDSRIFLGEGPMTFSDKPGRGFFHSDFFLEKKKPWIFPKKIVSTTRASMESWLLNAITENGLNPTTDKKGSHKIISEDFHPRLKTIEQPAFTEFHTVFAQLQQAIKQGALKKGVPVFFERWNEKVSLPGLLKALLHKTATISHEGFLYGLWNAKGGFLGFTPEMLFSLSGKNISLMALAGTSKWPGAPLFHDPKERQEHQLVVQGLKDTLKSSIVWNTFQTEEKKFGSLKHLCTKMKGTLQKPTDFTRLCRTLHPTAALSGFPKQAAIKWLKKNSKQKDRGSFGAPFGFFDGKDKGFCLVALRGVEWNSQSLKLGAGCGVVKNSILQKEWQELALKRNQIKHFFFDP